MLGIVSALGLALDAEVGALGVNGYDPRCETPDVEVSAEAQGVRVGLALWREPSAGHGIRGWSFVNFAPVAGGTHVDGLLAAFSDAGRARRGWVYGLHVTLAEPRFGQPTHDWLVNPELTDVVRRIVAPALASHRRRRRAGKTRRGRVPG